MNRKPNMSDLEKEMAMVETDAIVEEQYNADQNYLCLDNELRDVVSQIPYPQTQMFTVGNDYGDIDRLSYEKSCNKPYWEKQDELQKYCDNGSLYTGHLNLNGTNYYFMEKNFCHTKIIRISNEEVWLIDVDDRSYGNIVKTWRYPNENNRVQFSRNITMQNRRVLDVDIVLDKGNELFSNISDAYLRKALIRNKSKTSAQSIIQTIQKKQDEIRSLPKERSFIVQGCAGSGKTMVLLHRLRYLLRNKDIYNDEYVFLVPGNGFKAFIDEISTDFKINKRNILPYQEYYQEILGKKPVGVDTSELVFAPEYLGVVYSKEFIQRVYKILFDSFFKQIESLISFCDDKLVGLLESERSLLEKNIFDAKQEAIRTADEAAKVVQLYTSNKIENEYDNIQPLIEEIEEVYSQRKREYETAPKDESEIVISRDDERILTNKKLIEIQNSIDAESIALKKASMFTARSHKKKLEKLQEDYETACEALISFLVEADKAKYAEQALTLGYVYDGVSLTEVEALLDTLKKILTTASSIIDEAQENLENIDEYFGEKYSTEIEYLNKLIDASAEVTNYESNYVEKLLPAYTFFEENLFLGTELLSKFSRQISTDRDKKFVENELSWFERRTPNQLYAYLNTLLFNACKKKIFTDYAIKICDVYKHYWYLVLYCSYLTRPLKVNEKKYIFIDEAQDLSVSEIELINKVNSISGKPTVNLFGDVNQTITAHGITDWSQLQIISTVYNLDENFRNTNQIVDYCNRNLSIQMKKIGVDMEDVSEYKAINGATKESKTIFNNAVFIVKDDYCISDLKILLSKMRIINYEIYTVKSAKGLEFKEIFVFDSGMSQNEKYISYTRALAKLNVIKELPQTSYRESSLIIQGNDSEET